MTPISASPFALVALLLSSLGAQAAGPRTDDQTQLPQAPAKAASSPWFQPPAESSLPNNAFGALVRQGQAIFLNTKALAPQYVGNELACVNCHLDRGRKANSRSEEHTSELQSH